MIDFICSNIGIILNLIGTILIAFSFGPYPDKSGAPSTTDDKGKERYIAYFNYPFLFWTGIIILATGFFLQLNF